MVTPRSSDSPEGKWFTLVYTEAFHRLGWNLVYEQYPSIRCSILANNGVVDGEMERVYSFNTAYPNLIRVEEPLQTIKFVAFTTDSTLTLDGWESLKGRSGLINYRRGLKLCEEILPTVVKPGKLEAVNATENGLRKLFAGRIDLYVDIETVVAQALTAEEFAQASIYQAGVLQQVTTHPFLHKKHQERAPALAEVLKAMKEEGLFEIYWKQAVE